MRGLVFLLFATTLAGCSGLMMSGGSATTSTSERERAARVQASTDVALTEQIKQKFARDAVLRESTLYVSAKNGVARISGSVPTYEAREDAEKLAISTNGVVSVENKITVEFSN